MERIQGKSSMGFARVIRAESNSRFLPWRKTFWLSFKVIIATISIRLARQLR